MTISRRRFLGTSAFALGTAVVPLRNWVRAAGANERIRVAVIGLRGQGSRLAGITWEGKKPGPKFSEAVVALCDCDEQILETRADAFEREFHRKIVRYKDYRQLMDADDVDAVVIATPNHTHALLAVTAAQAGKDVYVEKPCSHNIWEGRQIVNAARKYNRVIQIGTQSRSDLAIRRAVQFVRDGKLGKLQHVIGSCYNPRPSIGKLDEPLKIPPQVDYNLWCGPAPQVDIYRPYLHYDWHWDFNTGCGDLGNQGIHEMDICRWFLGEEQLPPRVASVGARIGYDDAGDTPNTLVTYFDYPTAPLLFEVRGLPRAKEFQASRDTWHHNMDTYDGIRLGVVARCENGYIVSDHYHAPPTAFDNDGQVIQRFRGGEENHDQDSQSPLPSDRNTEILDGHVQNFLSAVRSRKKSDLNAEILDGHVSTSLCHLGSMSYRVGEITPTVDIAGGLDEKPLLADAFDRMQAHLTANEIGTDGPVLTQGPWLDIDNETEQITNNDSAQQLLTRECREAFVVPDLSS